MPTIDDKVVAMSFESAKFEQGVNSAIQSLEKLKASLKFPDAGKNLGTISDQAKRIDLGHISRGIEEVSSRLNALRLTAIAVFASIASKAISTGTQFVKALTVQPLIQGFREYELQINAVQTILANTAAAGTNIKDVNKVLDELNTYADKTIYNFGQMTRNIGTFTAAGVDLKTAVGSIKGIANLAAVSGSNADQASRAMYQLSQAISAGSVKLMDWNSVVNAGMGGSVFQRALAQTAMHMGTLKKGAVDLQGPMKNVRIDGQSFRNSLVSAGPGKEGWLTGKVLTNTLKQLSGDMTDAQLKAQGYTDAQIKAIQTQAKMAVEAATKVKTFTQLMTTLKEALGSGWAKSWRLILGDFGEAKKMFTSVSDTIGGFIQKNADARNKVLADWKKLGGRTLLIKSIKEAFHALGDILRPIKQAFRDIFPAKTGKDLFDLTVRLKEFTAALKPSPETVDNLRRTFRGLFALLDIGKTILGGIFSVFGRVFGQIFQGSGSFLELTARIGDWLVKVDKALKKGKYLENFFDRLGNVLAAPIIFIQELTRSFTKLFSGAFSRQANKATEALTPLQQIFEALGDALHGFASRMTDVQGIFEPIIQAFVTGLQQLGPAVSSALSGMSFEPILQVIRTGLLGGIFILFKNFLGKGSAISQLSEGFGSGIIGNISSSFDALSGSMKAMQRSLQAKTLKDIAIAVALLALSMVALSMVDPKKLNNALGAITIAFAQLLGAMAILGKISQSMGMAKTPIIAASLILLAGAILVLSTAVIALSFLSWEELLKGLGAVGVLLGGLVVATGPLSKASPRMIAAGAALIVIGVALNILALAVRQFGSMDLMTLGKGLASLGLTLFIIATYIKLFPSGKTMMLQAAGLVVIGVALNILALAVRQLGTMDLLTLGKGLAAIGASLAIVAGAMKLMGGGSKQMILAAAAMLVISVALQGIARAIQTLGGMSVEQLAKGVLTMTYALAALVGLLAVMQGSAAGAAALGVAAAGIAALAGAIAFIGKTPIKAIVVGLGALAIALGLIVAAGILMDAAAPGLLAFGAAVALVGAGLMLAGVGIGLAAAGIAVLVSAFVVAAGVVPQAMEDMVGAMIDNAKNLVLGFLEIVQAFAETAPQFVTALVEILNSVIDGIIQVMPKVHELITVLLTHILQIIHEQQAPLIQAGMDLLIALLQGIRNNIGQIVTTVVDIIVNFLNAIKANVNRIVTAGASLIIAILSGIAKYMGKITTAALNIVTSFLAAIAGQVGRIVTAGGRIIVNVLSGIAKNLGKIIKAGTDIIVAFITGIGNAGPRIVTAATNTIIKLMTALQQNANKLADAGFKVIIEFLNGIADTIEDNMDDLIAAGARIGVAIVKGIVQGLWSVAGDIKDAIMSIAKDKLPGWAKKALHISSPSKVFKEIGQFIMLGLAKGIEDTKDVQASVENSANGVIDGFKDIFQTHSESKVMYAIGRDVIKGFASGIKQGTEEDVRAAFGNMRQALAAEEAQVKKDLARRDVLLEKKKKTKEEITELNKLLKIYGDNEKVLNRIHNAQKYFNNGLTKTNEGLKKNKDALIGYAKELNKLNGYLEIAKGIFESFKDQYTTLPEFITTDEEGKPVEDQLGAYMKTLGQTVTDTEKFSATMSALKGLGLDDKTYEALLKAGPAAQKFADQLLAGGKPAVDAINALDTKLNTAAITLGNNAAAELYDAGEEAAKGFVSGLTSQIENIERVMGQIARKMVKRIKKELGITSPSEVFAKIGVQSMEGMAKGLEDSTGLVTDAADQAAKDALTAMERSMRDISDVVTEQLNTEPVITPILDLSDVKAKQAELAALTQMDATMASVSSISTGTAATEADKIAAVGTNFKFEQNNYSPEALSDIEIYRQTRNQLSQIKAALALT